MKTGKTAKRIVVQNAKRAILLTTFPIQHFEGDSLGITTTGSTPLPVSQPWPTLTNAAGLAQQDM